MRVIYKQNIWSHGFPVLSLGNIPFFLALPFLINSIIPIPVDNTIRPHPTTIIYKTDFIKLSYASNVCVMTASFTSYFLPGNVH